MAGKQRKTWMHYNEEAKKAGRRYTCTAVEPVKDAHRFGMVEVYEYAGAPFTGSWTTRPDRYGRYCIRMAEVNRKGVTIHWRVSLTKRQFEDLIRYGQDLLRQKKVAA